MTAILSAAEVAAMRGRHTPGLAQTGGRLCQACSSYSNAVYWPCDVVRLGDVCEALRLERDAALAALTEFLDAIDRAGDSAWHAFYRPGAATVGGSRELPTVRRIFAAWEQATRVVAPDA